ncbi:MAG: acyltransferase, partial [Alistipes sp.]|nr:acyltransferase [Alistipes sp.]
MDDKRFDDIRPYNDEEIPAALERIVKDPIFVPAMKFAFPDAKIERVAEVMRTCKTTDDMQERIMYHVIKRVI